eukprot:2747715-Pyramimonas_sp.AAC.1
MGEEARMEREMHVRRRRGAKKKGNTGEKVRRQEDEKNKGGENRGNGGGGEKAGRGTWWQGLRQEGGCRRRAGGARRRPEAGRRRETGQWGGGGRALTAAALFLLTEPSRAARQAGPAGLRGALARARGQCSPDCPFVRLLFPSLLLPRSPCVRKRRVEDRTVLAAGSMSFFDPWGLNTSFLSPGAGGRGGRKTRGRDTVKTRSLTRRRDGVMT